MLQSLFHRQIRPLETTVFLEVFSGLVFFILTAGHAARSGVCAWTFALGCFLLPFLIFLPLAGLTADRFPKRLLIRLTKTAGILIFLACLPALEADEPLSWFVAALIPLSVKSAFFFPALCAVLPETFREKELSRANGHIGFTFFTACTLGLPAALLAGQSGGGPGIALAVLLILSVCDLALSGKIQPTPSAVQVKKELRYPLKKAFEAGPREILREQALWLTALGGGLFLSMGTVLEGMVFLIASQTDFGAGVTGCCLICMALPAGLAVGSLCAGRLSGGKVELGLVPFGAFGVALFLIAAALFRGPAAECRLTIPPLLNETFNLYPVFILFLFLAGVSAGAFVIPVQACFQKHLRPEVRGAASAAYGLIGFFLLLALLLAAGFTVPLSRTAAPQTGLTPHAAVMIFAGTAFLLTLVCMWLLPEFALRFFTIAIGNTFFHTRISGAENIPEHGGALLISNHVSYLDSILISACTSRRIRFLMQEHFYRTPLISLIARLTGFIRVPEYRGSRKILQMFEEIRTALKHGDVICIFPEGHRTRNGITGVFKGGFRKMLPPDENIPVIPVCISGVWSTIFARRSKNFRRTILDARHPCITFGTPVSPDLPPDEIRRKITCLAAETAMERLYGEQTLHAHLLSCARRLPFRVHMRDPEGEPYTLLRTAREAILLSRKIRRRLDSDTKHIGILLPNSCLEAVSILASLYADRVPAPLNPTTAQDVLEKSVRKAGITHILTTRDYEAHHPLPEFLKRLYADEILASVPRWKVRLWSALPLLLPPRELLSYISPLSWDDVGRTAVLLFSSGSTGNPKGVMLSHHNMYSNAEAVIEAIALRPDSDNIVGNLPLFHSFGMMVNFWLPLVNGCQVSYLPNPLDASGMADLLARHKPTILFATPSFLMTYLRRLTPAHVQSLRAVITGAEKLRNDIRERFEQLSGGRRVIEAYGCTELSPVVTINLPRDLTRLGRVEEVHGSIGVAINNLTVFVADPLTHKPLPPDTEGLLFVKGPSVMQGYLKDPELTAKVIENGYYNTGDVVKMNEAGYLTICGRLSRFSKIAGEMVPHELVENIINELVVTEGRAVAVCGIPDPVKGEVLAVLYTPAMKLTPQEVVEQLRERSISNLWIPKVSNFHPVPELPLLGSGKLDLARLRKTAEDAAKSSVTEA